MSKANGKPLRFAALIRVSTERQEKKGESLATQRKHIDAAVASLGGKIVKRYAGQEHGTAGWERQQLATLLADAVKQPRPFDAVIVDDATRWSRDNVKSDTGLETLRDAGVRFFVLGTEHDLFKPEARLFLRMTATIGAYHATTQKQKSIENRIERAKRGLPTCGKLPFGRTFDEKTGKWGIDEAKRAMIAEVAERYLAGEQLTKLAKRFRVNHSNLVKVLRERCGDQWEIVFEAKDLNIRETVTMTIPRLLPDKTIQAVLQRIEANRTYQHGKPIHDYLLGGRVFCERCGYVLFGQTNPSGIRYYRHSRRERERKCDLNPRPWVPADKIEQAVVGQLFNLLGNPAAIERAVKTAVPDAEKLTTKRKGIEADLAKIDKARNLVLDRIGDLITEAQADKKLRELKDREADLRTELDKLSQEMAGMPDLDELAIFVERCGPSITITDEAGNSLAGGNDVMSFVLMNQSESDRRRLIAAAFDGVLPDGRPAGVWISPAGRGDRRSKRFTWRLRGRLVGGGTPRALP